MFMSFGSQGTPQESIFEYPNAAFGLVAPPLHLPKSFFPHPLGESRGGFRANPVVNVFSSQQCLVGGAAEPAIGSQRAKACRPVRPFHPLQARSQLARVGRRAGPVQLPVHDQSIFLFGQQEGVAKFHFRPGFAAHELFTSQLVLDETAEGDPAKASERRQMLSGLAILDLNEQVTALASELVERTPKTTYAKETDSVMAEVGRVKTELLKRYDYDLARMVRDTRSRQLKSGHPVVTKSN